MTFRLWDELSEVEQLQSMFSDFYKSVHGFRPRFASDFQWNSVEWLREQMCALEDESTAQELRVAAAQKEAIAAFEVRVDALIAAGAKDRETAIRWIFDSLNEDYVDVDPDYFCHRYGLPYGYFKEAV